jgi:ribosomal protein S5
LPGGKDVGELAPVFGKRDDDASRAILTINTGDLMTLVMIQQSRIGSKTVPMQPARAGTV